MTKPALGVFFEGLREPGTAFLSPTRMLATLGIKAEELATIAGVEPTALSHSPHSPRIQQSMHDIVRAVSAVVTGFDRSPDDAISWVLNGSIAEFYNRSVIDLIRQGRTDAVVAYLESIESGSVG